MLAIWFLERLLTLCVDQTVGIFNDFCNGKVK